ncbi:hypothetical protein Scep_018923 [Stephania cephalantha]|uniref:Uncharacterized protein n=1 Tax=Stephania cephalantha TaxID=152367 RepID=A0AAP0I9Y0_9MAGN
MSTLSTVIKYVFPHEIELEQEIELERWSERRGSMKIDENAPCSCRATKKRIDDRFQFFKPKNLPQM